MTTELEKQFFETFGIEPIAEYCKHQCNNELDESACIGCKYIEKVEYPQITDRHYLELMVLHNIYLETKLYSLDYKSLKKEILQDLIDEQQLREIKKDYVSDDLKHQVQAIFEEKE